MDVRSVVWIDANGNKTITRINTQGGAGSIMTSIILASTADYNEYWESAATVNGAPSPPGGAYQPVSLRAALYFQCSDNTIAVLLIPCPALSIFLADGETVDPANTNILALIANCIGVLASSSGSTAATYVGGKLLPTSRTPL